MEFLPLAEQTGLIGPLTSYVISAALRQSCEWALEGLDVPVAVNVSERSLLDPRFPTEVEALLERWGHARRAAPARADRARPDR